MHFSPSLSAPLHSIYLSTLHFKKTNLGPCYLFCFLTGFSPIINSSRLPASIWEWTQVRVPGHVLGVMLKLSFLGHTV